MNKLTLSAAPWLLAAISAHATFMVDLNPGGDALNLDNIKNSATSTGDVNGNLIDISVIGNAAFASGNATIKPTDKDTLLSSITFTPLDGDLFGSFSFRGQLNTAGGVTVVVQDNQGNLPQLFTFLGLPANADFSRIGIVSVSGSGETIQSVTISGDFKQQKQTEFGLAVPVPDAGSSVSLLSLGLIGLAAIRRRS